MVIMRSEAWQLQVGEDRLVKNSNIGYYRVAFSGTLAHPAKGIGSLGSLPPDEP